MRGRGEKRSERRIWPRLPLAIPVFVRGVDEHGAQFLEFTSAYNVSAGGMLVGLRHQMTRSSRATLEIPAAPMPDPRAPTAALRTTLARLVRIEDCPGGRLCGFRFTRPLVAS